MCSTSPFFIPSQELLKNKRNPHKNGPPRFTSRSIARRIHIKVRATSKCCLFTSFHGNTKHVKEQRGKGEMWGRRGRMQCTVRRPASYHRPLLADGLDFAVPLDLFHELDAVGNLRAFKERKSADGGRRARGAGSFSFASEPGYRSGRLGTLEGASNEVARCFHLTLHTVRTHFKHDSNIYTMVLL